MRQKSLQFILLVLLLNLLPLSALAQKALCPRCYGTGRFGYGPCLTCNATGWVANAMVAQEETRNYSKALFAHSLGLTFIGSGNDEKGFEEIKKAALDYNLPDAYLHLGNCLELGIGTAVNHEIAKNAYEIGSKLGGSGCSAALNRIESEGFWSDTDENRQSYRRMIKNQVNASAAAGSVGYGGISPYRGGSSGSSSSSGTACTGCGGSGKCSSCGGDGYFWSDTGTYVGRTINKKISCGACRGTGRCGVCRGTGRL